ncbi:hypothetical protein EZH22_21245 [Xanthobacter dioxanivorans]|uniref:SH3 domain-containing protein n=1 Tax=Xanthobacter dioxanivorans TaxID=2528964 RepID=A0A974PL34_9HYPH|nr:hypothetical protein [Xanthobacter dioxanivorans]QRG05567.1 hypothetical protein EZH22_21245 [Xanthobacter dioxanivorans]
MALVSGVALWLLAPLSAWAEEAAWVAETKAKLPPGIVLGRIPPLDAGTQTASIPAYPAAADQPASAGSAFDPGQMLDVTLKTEGGILSVVAATLRPRRQDERPNDDVDDSEMELLRTLAAMKKAEPEVEPCHIFGWAMHNGRKGIAVRAAPSGKAKAVGRLAPLHRTAESDQGSEPGWRVEFEITGYKDGWFRISHATPPGAPYGDPPPKRYPKTYSGTGWIRTSEAGGAYANTQMPVQHLLQAPHVDAQDFVPGSDVAGPDGNLSIDGTLMRLHACSANWALTTSRDGRRGWWRGICSNQVTNCS